MPDVNLELSPTAPPNELFHGTVAQFLASIRVQGLLKRSRNHVHLSSDRETATKVGMRRGKPVVLAITSAEMHHSGHQFFLSAATSIHCDFRKRLLDQRRVKKYHKSG